MSDISLKDMTDEAKRFDLEPSQYDMLRGLLRKRIEGEIREEVQKQEKDRLRDEVRREVREELLPDLRKRVEGEMRLSLHESVKAEVRQATITELKASTLKEARDAVLAEVPSPAERAHFLSYFQDMEIECATYADIAASRAQKVWDRRTLVRAIRQPAFFLLLVVYLPVLAALHFYGWAPDSFRFIATGIGGALAVIVLAITNSNLYEQLQKDFDIYNGIAVEYRVLSGMAKRFMLVGRTAKTRYDLKDSTDSFQMSRQDIDRRFAPEGADIERSRERVAQRFLMANVDMKTRIEDLDEVETTVDPQEAHRTV